MPPVREEFRVQPSSPLLNRQITKLALAGRSAESIAETLHISIHYIEVILNSPLYRTRLKHLKERTT